MKILTVAFMLLFNRETKCLPDAFTTWAGVCVWGGEVEGGGGASYFHHAQHPK